VSEFAGGRLRLDSPADHVARLTIDNQAKRNALDRELLDAFAAALREVECRCLLLTAAGSTFSAGYDIRNLAGDAEAGDVVAAHFQAALATLDAFRFPVVAALNGHAIGGGLELALACDLRIAASGAKLGMPPARLGLIYSHTGLRRFVDTIGAPRTRELFFTARYVPAEVALEWGLVNRVVGAKELASEAVELAAGIAANAPLSLQGSKRAIRALLAAEGALDPEVARELVALREACFRSEDFREGVRAFGEKRAPEWKGR
jgi:enoyl-CoA hydratase/carnithine racemase